MFASGNQFCSSLYLHSILSPVPLNQFWLWHYLSRTLSLSLLLPNTFTGWPDHCLVSIWLLKVIHNPVSFPYINKLCRISPKQLNPLKMNLTVHILRGLQIQQRNVTRDVAIHSSSISFWVQIIILACLLCQKAHATFCGVYSYTPHTFLPGVPFTVGFQS